MKKILLDIFRQTKKVIKMAKPTKLDRRFRKGKISRREYEEQKIITGEFLRWHTKIYSQRITE